MASFFERRFSSVPVNVPQRLALYPALESITNVRVLVWRPPATARHEAVPAIATRVVEIGAAGAAMTCEIAARAGVALSIYASDSGCAFCLAIARSAVSVRVPHIRSVVHWQTISGANRADTPPGGSQRSPARDARLVRRSSVRGPSGCSAIGVRSVHGTGTCLPKPTTTETGRGMRRREHPVARF